jgi:hypothetical protein
LVQVWGVVPVRWIYKTGGQKNGKEYRLHYSSFGEQFNKDT